MNWGHDRGRDIRYKNCGESRQDSSVQFGTVRIYSKVQEEPWNLLENLLIILENFLENLLNIGGTYEHWGTAPLSGLVKETTLKAL